MWTTRADVIQTVDNRVHATQVTVAEDGTLVPTFVNGLGTGHWHLLGSEGQHLWRSGPELGTAVTRDGSTPPRYTDGTHPTPVIRWAGSNSGHSGQQDAEAKTAKRTRRRRMDKAKLNEWVVRAKNEGGAETAAAGLKWVNEKEVGVGKDAWAAAWRAADGKEKRVWRPGVDKAELNEWVVRAKDEGGAETAAAGLQWVNEKGVEVSKNAWGDAWRAAAGKEKRVQRPGVDRARLAEWVARAQEEGGAETVAAGLKWVNEKGVGVGKNAWGDAWRAADGKEKRVQRPGVPRERLAEWVARAQEEGGAKSAREGLKWVQGQGVGIDQSVWFVAWRGGAALDHWSADFEDEGDPFSWEGSDGVGERDVDGDLDLLPVDWGNFADWEGWPQEDVSSSVGGVGQREPVGDEASERGSGEVYPGESLAGPSTVQAAHQGSAGGGVAASGQQDADGRKAKRVRRPGVDKERLKEWVGRAKNEGGVTTAAAGLKWVQGQGLAVSKNTWGDAWRAATGKEKLVQRPGVPRERLAEWVVRAQVEGGAKTIEAGLEWVHGQGNGVNKNAWADAWRAETGKEKRVQRPGVPRERLAEWVVRAQEEGGAKTIEAGLKWVQEQGIGVDNTVWGEAWRGRGVLDHWSADLEDEGDPFLWEGSDGVGERDVDGDLDLLPVDWGNFADWEGLPEEVYPVESQAGPSTVQAAHQGSALEGVAASGQQDANARKAKRVRRSAIDKERLKEWVERAKNEGGVTTAAEGLKWARAQGLRVRKTYWGDAWRAATGNEKLVQRPGVPRERLNEWVVRAQQEGGAKTAAAGLEWVNRQGVGVNRKDWAAAWRGRGVLDHWSADFEDDEDPFVWERGVGEGDVGGVLGLSPVDWGSFAESEGWSEVEVARLQLAAAQWVSPLLFAPVFVGVKPPERVAFDWIRLRSRCIEPRGMVWSEVEAVRLRGRVPRAGGGMVGSEGGGR